jgi:hypothetical protein
MDSLSQTARLTVVTHEGGETKETCSNRTSTDSGFPPALFVGGLYHLESATQQQVSPHTWATR